MNLVAYAKIQKNIYKLFSRMKKSTNMKKD